MIVFIGSLFIGMISALMLAFIMKRQAAYKDEHVRDDPNLTLQQKDDIEEHGLMMEVAMMLACPYTSYLIAEGLELSGIVSILINGIFLSYYAGPNLSERARHVLRLAYETIAFASETIVFVFLGLGMFAFDHPYGELTFLFVICTIGNLLLARAVNILVVSFLCNLGRSKESKIGWNLQFVMWIAGLRGAMAYALALKSYNELPVGPVILTDTLIFSLLTILVIGSFLNPLLSKLGVKRTEAQRTMTMDPSEVTGK